MKKKLIEQPLSYWEAESYMMVIPKNQEEDILKIATEKITTSKEFEVKDLNININGVATLNVLYENEEYKVGFYAGGISVPEYYLSKNYLFKESEIKNILAAQKALTIFMKFNDNAKKSYHLQLKLAHTLIPDLIGVMDESAEKMLPEKWVHMAASSKVLPSAKDLFNVQAISGKNNKVWLHTHGLCRCGLTELEILESDQEHYKQHYNLIMTYAMFLIDKINTEDQEKGTYIGRLINGYPIVVTSLPWPQGIQEYKKLKLGGSEDRAGGHNSKSNIIFLYTSKEDEQNKILHKVSVYDDLWGDNPIFFFSDEETDRMKELAKERFSYVASAFQNKENTIILKIGLPLKEEGKFEHIWFELLEIKGEKFKAKLTQEPYDVPNIHTGYEAWFTKADITDWIIYTKKYAVSPDNIYLLEDSDQSPKEVS